MKRKAPRKTKFKTGSRATRLRTLVNKNNALLRKLKQKGPGELIFLDDDVKFDTKRLLNRLNTTPVTGKEAIKDRSITYGDYETMALVSQKLKNVLRDAADCSERGVVLSPLCESLEVICQKLARIACGDPNYIDSWADIAGYAELAIKHIQTTRERL